MDTPTNQLLEVTRRSRNAFWVAVVFVISSLVATAIFLVPALQTDDWQLYVSAGVSVFLAIVSAVSIWVTRSGRSELGVELIIGTFLPVATVGAVLIANVGLVMGIGVVLLVSIIAFQTLPPQKLRRTTLVAVGAGIIMILIGLFGTPYQLALLPQLPVFLAILTAGALVVYGVFVVRHFADYTLRVKLIIAFLVVALIPIGVLLFLNTRASQTALTDSANQSLLAAASQTAAGIDTFFQSNLASIQTEAKLPGISARTNLGGDEASRQQHLFVISALSSKDPENIISYGLLNEDGVNVVDTNLEFVDLNEAGRDYFRKPIETGDPYVSPVLFLPNTDEAVLIFSAPVHNLFGEFHGVLRVIYKASILQNLLETVTEQALAKSIPILLDENHLRIAHGTEPKLIFKTVVPLEPDRLKALQADRRLPNLPPAELSTNIPAFEAGLLTSHTDEPFFTTQLVATLGELDSAAVVSLKIKPWLVVFAQPQAEFLAPIQAQTRNTLLLAILIAVIVIAVAVLFAQFLARPITNLTATARQVAGGDLNVRAQIESRDETGQLAATFNSMTDQLQGIVGSLEEQVQERTAELALSMEVGQRASTFRDLDELLPTIIEFIRDRFNLYYAHIYFLDDVGQNLIIRVGTGAVGAELMARRHNLPVRGTSIVGRVASENRSIVVSDTATSDIHKPNPLLPHTRSEMAIPLLVEEQVIGVLDMQATEVDTFTTHNLTVFEAMATQLAISIDSARQWQLAQDTQQRSEEAVAQLTRDSWAEKLTGQQEALSFAYDLSTMAPFSVDQAANPDNGGLSAPIVVQNQRIGRFSVESETDRNWSEEEQALLEAVTQQLAQKVENLRLFEETQNHAAREQKAREIADIVRASGSVEDALQAAVSELSKAMGNPRIFIKLNVEGDEK